jgi:1,4-dihydroxy-2-naphthoate octaprenyltransferase
MTQIYQHEEDLRRGDITISSKLGILGTFHFTAVFFSLSVVLFSIYFIQVNGLDVALLFVAALLPVLGYFGYWYTRVRKSEANADYQHTMWLNFISSSSLNLFFLYLYLA